MAGYICREAVLVYRLSLAEHNRKPNYSGLKTGEFSFLSEKNGLGSRPLQLPLSLSRILIVQNLATWPMLPERHYFLLKILPQSTK